MSRRRLGLECEQLTKTKVKLPRESFHFLPNIEIIFLVLFFWPGLLTFERSRGLVFQG